MAPSVPSVPPTKLPRRGVEASKVILFGSFATGQYTEDSDIDLVIVSSDFEEMGYWQRIDILSDAIYELFQPIEAIAMTPQEWENEDSPAVQFARGGETVYDHLPQKNRPKSPVELRNEL